MEDTEKTHSRSKRAKKFKKALKKYIKLKRKFTRCHSGINYISKLFKKNRWGLYKGFYSINRSSNIIKELDNQELSLLFEEYGVPRGKKSSVELDLNDLKHFNLFQKLAWYKLPLLKVISLRVISICTTTINKFLLNSIPKDQKRLFFNTIQNLTYDCSNYFYELREAASRVTQIVCISYLKMSCEEFCLLVKASKNSLVLIYCYCTILTDSECDFGEMEESKIKLIDFMGCESKEYSNWKEYPDRRQNILSGIEKCKSFDKNETKIRVNKNRII